MRVVKAAAVQLSPVLYSREGTVDKVVRKIDELGQQGVQFATFPENGEPSRALRERRRSHRRQGSRREGREPARDCRAETSLHELELAAAARAIRNGDVPSETYQQLTGKPAQMPRDFLLRHKAALTAAA